MAILAPTLLNSADGLTSGGGEDLAVTGITAAAGDLLIAAVSFNENATIDAVTDSAGNTWSIVRQDPYSGGSDVAGAILRCVVTNALSSGTVTVSFSAFNAAMIRVYKATVDGGWSWPSNPDDGTTSAEMDFATAYDSGGVTTTAADCLLFGVHTTNDEAATFTAGGSATELDDVAASNPPTRLQAQYRIVTATGTYSASATCSTNSDGVSLVAAFKATTAAAVDYSSVDGSRWVHHGGSGNSAVAA